MELINQMFFISTFAFHNHICVSQLPDALSDAEDVSVAEGVYLLLGCASNRAPVSHTRNSMCCLLFNRKIYVKP